jgi:hypothetical protein
MESMHFIHITQKREVLRIILLINPRLTSNNLQWNIITIDSQKI